MNKDSNIYVCGHEGMVGNILLNELIRAIKFNFLKKCFSMVSSCSETGLQAVKDGNNRFLFEMATGTGKTLIAAAVIKLFLRTSNAKRVLFLVDRLELEDQAWKAFVRYLKNDYKTVIYKQNRDDWRKAEIVIWLDLPFKIVFWRTFLRTVIRLVTRRKLWNNNIEGFDALFGPDSMPLWIIKTYWGRKKEYPVLLAKLQYSHLQVIRLKSIGEIKIWLESL